MAAGKVECPVCGKSFPIQTINLHVDECLKMDEGKVNEESSPVKRKHHDEDVCGSGGGGDEDLVGGGDDADADGDDEFVGGDGGGGGFVGGGGSKSWGSLIPYSKKLKVDKSPKLNRKHGANTNASPSSVFKNRKSKTFALFSEDAVDSKGSKGSNPGKDCTESTRVVGSNNTEVPSLPVSTNTQNTNVSSKQSTESSLITFNIPLAESLRPKTMENFIGQTKSLGEQSFIRRILLNYSLPPSIIFWGPPGSGKTTLAKLISNQCKENHSAKFLMLSATNSGVNDVKQATQVAKTNQKMFKMKTILFIDEVHRFNKIQQDCLLPHVEDGTFILLGATTENPSFHVNSALLSRCHVVVLEKLSVEEVSTILLNAVKFLKLRCFSDASEIDKVAADKEQRPCVWINNKVIEEIAFLCDGDGRVALNCLQMAVQSQIQKTGVTAADPNAYSPTIIDVGCVKESLERSCILYDKKGEEHYNCASALQKSIRGSDPDAALYWTARMLEGGEDPRFVARRLVRTASEDIGLADPLALTQAVAAFQATNFIGMPECDVILAQCAVYLARAPKSIEVYSAYTKAKQCILGHRGPLPSVPLHLRNATTGLMKSLGYGDGYVRYGPGDPALSYLPSELSDTKFLE